jgi:hypothetical protein
VTHKHLRTPCVFGAHHQYDQEKRVIVAPSVRFGVLEFHERVSVHLCLSFSSIIDCSIDDPMLLSTSVLAVEPLQGESKARRVSSGYKVAVATAVASSAEIKSAAGLAASQKLLQQAQGLEKSGCKPHDGAFAEEHMFQYWTNVRRETEAVTECLLGIGRLACKWG